MPEAEEVVWSGLKGLGKGMKAGAQGSLKAAEKVSMGAIAVQPSRLLRHRCCLLGPREPAPARSSLARLHTHRPRGCGAAAPAGRQRRLHQPLAGSAVSARGSSLTRRALLA